MGVPTVLDHAVVLLIVVVLPLYSWTFYPRVKRRLAVGEAGTRIREYVETILILWSGTALAVGFWIHQNRSTGELGLGLSLDWRFYLGLAITATVILFLVWQVILVARHQEYRDHVRAQMEAVSIDAMIPRTVLEYRWFLLVALSAGICEEILYRGYLISYLSEYVGKAGALVLSSVLFGTAHAYQGLPGVWRTMMAGAIAAILFACSGTLWFSIILHVAVDIHGGTIARYALRLVESKVET